jgi:hypothetical protein
MRHTTTVLAGLLAAANAQKEFGGKGPGAPKPGCLKLADVKPIADPFYMFEPGKADFHCDMGAPIPFGPVPSGCAKLEIIVGKQENRLQNQQHANENRSSRD